MAEETVASPGAFQRLRELERLGYQHGADLPAQDEAVGLWAGVGFRLGGQHFLAALDEVIEILTPPDLSRVPRARTWVRGIANVRGNLLPVIDLGAFLGKGRASPSRLARVLVTDRRSVVAGLLVDEVLGMRQFEPEEWRGQRHEDESIAPYVQGGYLRDGILWPVFSLERLVSDPGFMQVAE